VTIGEPVLLAGPVEIVPYDPAWPAHFRRQAGRLRGALGERALLIEHAGSTSVPGLAAKPVIDVILAVAGSADEPSYVPALEQAGFVLRIREPGWFEHRLLKGADPETNVHVFSAGCPEIARMLLFRDRLRADDAARAEYENTKRELARRDWKYLQNYADAKSAVIDQIVSRGAP
jgi:GrpB-like predicted nucleotidyltransferase (UPF0157 family)